ncbi:hypothetical protein EAI_00943, partial [Harpegnathos saltator]
LKKLRARWECRICQQLSAKTRSNACLAHFNRFKQNKMDFKRRFVTVDET